MAAYHDAVQARPSIDSDPLTDTDPLEHENDCE